MKDPKHTRPDAQSEAALRDDVVALYVDALGPYPLLVREWYDAKRNAMTYRGNLPVVAHPPCGPWSGLSHLHKHAEELALAPHAVAVVQRCGGVLEHPAGSRLFGACGMPIPPDDGVDAFGGWSIEVCQVDWGHVARKRTWLYIVGPAPGHHPAHPAAARADALGERRSHPLEQAGIARATGHQGVLRAAAETHASGLRPMARISCLQRKDGRVMPSAAPRAPTERAAAAALPPRERGASCTPSERWIQRRRRPCADRPVPDPPSRGRSSPGGGPTAPRRARQARACDRGCCRGEEYSPPRVAAHGAGEHRRGRGSFGGQGT